MDKSLVYTRPDGGVSVVIPAPALWADYQRQGLSEQQFLEDVAASSIPQGTAYEVMDKSELPANRTYRDAWKLNGRVVELD